MNKLLYHTDKQSLEKRIEDVDKKYLILIIYSKILNMIEKSQKLKFNFANLVKESWL